MKPVMGAVFRAALLAIQESEGYGRSGEPVRPESRRQGEENSHTRSGIVGADKPRDAVLGVVMAGQQDRTLPCAFLLSDDIAEADGP